MYNGPDRAQKVHCNAGAHLRSSTKAGENVIGPRVSQIQGKRPRTAPILTSVSGVLEGLNAKESTRGLAATWARRFQPMPGDYSEADF